MNGVNTEKTDNYWCEWTWQAIGDIATKNDYTEIMFLDDNANVKVCGEYKVVGNCKCASQYTDSNFIIAIGNTTIHKKIQMQLVEDGLYIVSLIHPKAVIVNIVESGKGKVDMAGAIVNPYEIIGQGCIISTCSSVEHDCAIGDFVYVSVGSHITGTVVVGNSTWIGAGATVSNNVEIASDCRIGAVVIKI